ncbi:MAG: hypothetical protein WCO09_02985 [bacterium]
MPKIVLIGGYPKGYKEPFHPKTTSGRILRKIVGELNIDPIYFDLWSSKEEEDSRKLSNKTKKKLVEFEKGDFILISLGKYIEKVLIENKIKSRYLPHPASRDKKYVEILKSGLKLCID